MSSGQLILEELGFVEKDPYMDREDVVVIETEVSSFDASVVQHLKDLYSADEAFIEKNSQDRLEIVLEGCGAVEEEAAVDEEVDQEEVEDTVEEEPEEEELEDPDLDLDKSQRPDEETEEDMEESEEQGVSDKIKSFLEENDGWYSRNEIEEAVEGLDGKYSTWSNAMYNTGLKDELETRPDPSDGRKTQYGIEVEEESENEEEHDDGSSEVSGSRYAVSSPQTRSREEEDDEESQEDEELEDEDASEEDDAWRGAEFKNRESVIGLDSCSRFKCLTCGENFTDYEAAKDHEHEHPGNSGWDVWKNPVDGEESKQEVVA